MNQYKKQIKVVSKNDKVSDSEKIAALKSLLEQFENEYQTIDSKLDNNFMENQNKKSRFYFNQMLITVLAGIVTMATATKSLETTELLTLNNLICGFAGTITAAGIGSMALEELGFPILEEDRQINKMRKLGLACIEIKNILENLENSNQREPQ